MKILITGSAGFIGSALTTKLLDQGNCVVGIDNLNNYYDISLKKSRLALNSNNPNYNFYHINIEDKKSIESLFEEHQFDTVVNLAAQAGVRYSIENPKSYIQSNIIGTFNILEVSKKFSVKHFLMASTSSVYGSNKKMPFHENQKASTQMSFYAATKKANESMTHSYSYTYEIPTTIFRFFTVYGPWGRPDMALFKFTKAILEDEIIDVYNYGKMTRDFTYVLDIVEAIRLLVNIIPETPDNRKSSYSFDSISDVAPWRVVNIGNAKSVTLIEYIETLEKQLGKTANKKLMKMQIGDVPNTMSDISLLMALTGFKPKTNVSEGIKNFVEWYKSYY